LPISAFDPRSIMPPLINSYRPYHSYRPRRTWYPGTTSYHGRATSPRCISPPCSKRCVDVPQSHDGVGWSFSMLAPTICQDRQATMAGQCHHTVGNLNTIKGMSTFCSLLIYLTNRSLLRSYDRPSLSRHWPPSPPPRAFSSNGNRILHRRALDKKLSKRSAWTKRVYVFTLFTIRFVNKLLWT